MSERNDSQSAPRPDVERDLPATDRVDREPSPGSIDRAALLEPAGHGVDPAAGHSSDETESRGGGAERKAGRRELPWLTLVLVAANVAIALIQESLGGLANPATLIVLGAKVTPRIEDGEYWRLVTANFLHVNWMHLLWNMVVLLFLGMLVELFYGRTRFLIIYVLTGVAGTVASFKYTQGLSAGASAALFGLMGAIVVHNLRYRAHLPPEVTTRLRVLPLIVVMELALGYLSPGIDVVGHLGGLAAGILFGFATESRIVGARQAEREWLPLPAALATAACLLLYGFGGWGWNAERQVPLLRGAVVEERGEVDRALATYRFVLRRHPEMQDLRSHVIALLVRQKRWAEAQAEFSELVRRGARDPRYAESYRLALMVAGQSALRERRWGDAADRYREALAAASWASIRPEVQNALAYTLADKLGDNPQALAEALPLAESATTAAPENPGYLDTLAWIYYRLGRHDEARRVQQLALRRVDADPEMQFHMAAIWEALGQRSQAIQAYRAAVRHAGNRKDDDAKAAVRESEGALERLGAGAEPLPKGSV